jgi:Carbohydrate esterase 2 N-terminal/GDSL-like Lipase/Acylhydrolase family
MGGCLSLRLQSRSRSRKRPRAAMSLAKRPALALGTVLSVASIALAAGCGNTSPAQGGSPVGGESGAGTAGVVSGAGGNIFSAGDTGATLAGATSGGTASGGAASGGSDAGGTNASQGGSGGASGAGGMATAGAAGGSQAGAAGTSGTPGVRIVGRTVPGANGAGPGSVRFEWSGTSVAARFKGTQVSASLNDANNGNSFAVVIDGGAPKKIFSASGQTSYVLATGLANGVHDLLLWRDTEANDGPTEFIGLSEFGAGGALLPPAPAPDRRIEIIGDSFSCGAGMEGTPPACGSPIKIENHYLSYGAIAARAVGADLVTIAWSGIGVWRNYGTTKPTPTTVMPARYDYAIPTDTSKAWDFSKYQPQVVVMNLNNNDFSTGDPGQPYITAYLAFYQHVRAKYPTAYIIHIIQWSSAEPAVTDAVTTINGIVATLKAGGDSKTEAFDIRKFSNTKQCGGHPDMAASQAMGDALAAELRTVLGW